MPENYYRFDLVPLPYDYNALEPYIDTETMHYHHDKHLKTYVDNLNKVVENNPKLQGWSLEQMLMHPYMIPSRIRTDVMNNGGGVYNHNFFFRNLRPGIKDNKPAGNLANAINAQFGSFNRFKEIFKTEALKVFGSGYLWLVLNRRGDLMLFPTANQGTPITYGLCPVITLDVWEHAYYLKHKNRRDQYIDDWWNVVNWNQAEENLGRCKALMRW